MSNPAAELFFEKISHYDRPQEPVTCGIPFPRGAMSREEQFALHDGAAEVYCQKSVTGRWDDGSIRWLLVQCLLDLPGGSGKSFRFTVEDQARDPVAPPAALTLADEDEAVLLDTGPLQVTLSISGKHRRGADDFLDYVIRIHAWAGKSCLAVQYQFINREERPQVAVREIHLKGRLSAAGGAVSLTSGQGVYRTLKMASEREVEIGVDAAKMLRDPSEHQDECFYGDFWVDWNGPRGGVTLTIRQA